MNKGRRVYCLGDANVDVILPIQSYPTLGSDRRSEGMVLEVGGSVTNSAILMSRLGMSATLLACLGQDIFADFVRNSLAETSLDLAHLHSVDNLATGMMFVPVTKDGQRTLFGQRGANRSYKPDYLPGSFDAGSALLLSGYALLESPQSDAAAKVLELASTAESFIAMDTAYEPPLIAPEAFKPYFNHLDLLVLGEEEAKKLGGHDQLDRAIQSIQYQGVNIIALKMGKNGSQLIQGDARVTFPALPQKVVDTTGAGDNYTGALLHGLMAQLPLETAGLLAAAASAHIISRWGAGKQAAWPDDLAKILQSTPSEVIYGLETAKNQALSHLDGLAANVR